MAESQDNRRDRAAKAIARLLDDPAATVSLADISCLECVACLQCVGLERCPVTRVKQLLPDVGVAHGPVLDASKPRLDRTWFLFKVLAAPPQQSANKD